jgi:alkylation response protein AidB-like acyl-CoA dehydrogenase
VVGAYCLTEPGAGSDANSKNESSFIRRYSITGQKMWISNAGFCSVFIVLHVLVMIKKYWFYR